MPKRSDIKKVLVIGSGPIVIGQAAEFDYAGAQACRVLKDAGVNVVLCNSNPATIMTDKMLADEIYLEPLTLDSLKRIIIKERPDSLLASLGGQTGLTMGCKLAKEGFLDEWGVKLIGTKLDAIDRAEDRELFKETMQKIGQPVVPSDIAYTVDECVAIAEKLGYPVIVRPAFTLGGAGGGVAYDEEELRLISHNGLMLSPITQVLIEKYIGGWKEIEFEVLRDSAGNVITVCSMENFDPVGIHTGDSIVIAPAVTLSDKEYQMLRTASLDIITELGIEGGCNCQFALHPDSFEYAVIEVNPRVSRSSALASKATGYPIAKVATKIALGYTLDEIRNDVTGKTYACFEPAIDYVVVKLPKWPFDKFLYAGRTLGSRMKATGEVMAIGTSFEQAIMKAVRGAEISLDTLNHPKFEPMSIEQLREELHKMTDERLFAVYQALKKGISIDEIYATTKIDEWFLAKLKNLADYEAEITGKKLTRAQYLEGKRIGYTDKALERFSGEKLPAHRRAVFKMVDTCAAEFSAKTPYFYSTYDELDHDEALPFVQNSTKKRVIVIGSGPIRIGQGIEFDYSSVHCVWTLKELGYEVIIINNNPETVSTDFDTADRLYFESLTPEDVQNVIDVEKPYGVVITFGGQTAIKLCGYLAKKGVRILGTSADSVDMAEDRERFDELLEHFHIARPKGLTVMTKEEAIHAAETLGYPVLLRPSYVIGGQNMTIAFTENDISRYMDVILAQHIENPVLCDKYLMGSELEVDAISDGVDVLIPGIMQHIERAGVHSGDSIAVYPPYHLSDAMLEKIVDISTKLALSLKTKGLINIQYLIYQNQLYVIEVNPRASRTIPYISKVTGVPMVELATKIMVGAKLKKLGYGTGLYPNSPYVAVKVPVFSFEKLNDVNSQLGPEMKSTGEVLGIGKTIEEALFKGLVSAGFKMCHPTAQKPVGVYFTVNDQDKFEIVSIAKKFADLGCNLYATAGTAKVISDLGIDVTIVDRLKATKQVSKLMDDGKIDYIIYTGKTDVDSINDYIELHHHAILLGITVLTSLDTANALCDIIASKFTEYNTELVDINNLRTKKTEISFVKMQSCGNDYIYFEDLDGKITCPESLAVNFVDRHYGIGGDGIVLIERSDVADAKMRIFNQDGSEGQMAGNSIRCVAKYLYEKGIVKKETMTIETLSGVREVKVYSFGGIVTSASADLGKAVLDGEKIPSVWKGEKIVGQPMEIDGVTYHVTLVNMGNPHCIIFCDKVDDVPVETLGPKIEHSEYFPAKTNVEFIRVVNESTIKMRVWERGNGETWACGTGAAAAAVACVLNGLCKMDTDITVKVKGGDLVAHYRSEDGHVILTGNVEKVYDGTVEF
ncbi:MAG TPA: carbamoyl-phosphate synthase large subunit [Candidatus Gallimonas intestinigallinarum]|uniref:Multifunctional fusion protein n=1 Tax=Candidatus Gallimonas intestinigallinarum TaxID=2838604 RepID=A0A9D2DXV8_9FIRM|nr:carbamoyl-phosphate synthase large subunit [Candidatus Gallimonas intestinigallinarum]